SAVRAGVFTGSAGECGYFPWNYCNQPLHVLVLGIGATVSPGARTQIPSSSWLAVENNLKKMGPQTWGLSRSEFPQKAWEQLSKSLPEGGALWIGA
ncbi:MAG: hypothetical protein KGQ59_06720, partial [Bdellovibrionales bacterium]|nr:hypothetical protein [Bdellovibrionales bacterium]